MTGTIHAPMSTARPFLAAVRNRLVRMLLVDGAARALALGTVLVLVAVGADRLWDLPAILRGAMLASILATVASVLWVRVLRPLRRDLGDRELARFVERRRPELGGRLLTVVSGIPLGADEPRLEAVLATCSTPDLIPARRTRRQVGIGLAAVAVIAGAVAADPGLAWDGFRRLATPWAAVPWRRLTTIEVRAGRVVVPVDESLRLQVQRQHRDPGFSAPVEVSWRSADGRTPGDNRTLNGLTGRTWDTTLSLGVGRWTVSAQSGDAVPAEVAVRVVRRPRLAGISVQVEPPRYSGSAAATAATVAGTFLPGTRLAFRLSFDHEPDRPVVSASASFIPASGPVVPLVIEGAVDGGWCGGLTVDRPGVVEILAADGDGIACAQPARFPLTITPDRPPVVTLAGPLPREGVTVRAVLDLGLAATDDLGLATVDLRASVPATAAASIERVLYQCPAVSTQTAVDRHATVEVAGLAAEGSQVVFVGQATDRNDVTGPGVGRSEPLAVRVISEDALRQELDRVLGEARERIVAARDGLAGAADAARRDLGLRSAAQAAGRADELLVQALRRWQWNRLPDEGIRPAAAARTLVAERALPDLARGQDAAARGRADGALAEAERLLGSILQEGDLTRLLSSLIARQQALATDTRGFVRAFLTKPLDAAGKALQQNLAGRQKELAEQVAELERRILAKDGSSWKAAQSVVRSDAPGERLRSAAADIATADRRPSAVDAQRGAVEGLGRLLEALRGGDAAGELARKIGQLAAEQERLAGSLERGAPPASQTEAQQDLAARTAAAARAASGEAATLLGGAGAAQRSATGAMQGNNRAAAARDASAAAGLLREAQRRLSGEAPPAAAQKLDVLALLRTLRAAQAILTAEVAALAETTPSRLDFARSREVQTLASRQGDLRLRLDQDAIKPLTGNPIAALALGRVSTAMEAARAHLATPALGDRGQRLTRTALAELNRLLAVAEAKPPAATGSPVPAGGGKASGAEQQRPPFPPQAELALLAAMQQEVALLTAVDRPTDLAAAQEEVQHLVEGLMATTRPGTRPAELLERARRATTSAAFRLRGRDRGAVVCIEQDAAELSLRRLLAEAGGDGGGGSSSGGGGSPQPQAAGGGSPPPPGGDGQGQGTPQGGEGQPAASGAAGQTRRGDGETTRAAASDSGDLLQLPPQIRDQLRQAREQHFTPAQLQIYQRYLELLESGK